MSEKQSKQSPVVQQIIQQLNHEGAKHPGAILLAGRWGVGKTHLWHHEIKRNLNNKKCVYISLFGLSTIADFKSRLLTTLIGQMAADAVGWKGALDWGSNILRHLPKLLAGGLNETVKKQIGTDVLSYLEGFNIKFDPMQMFPRDVIVCIDDLERTTIPSEAILGVICSLIEQKNAKVLLIANEQYLIKGDSNAATEKQNEKYRSFKERVIWLTLTWSMPLSGVFDCFVEQLCEKKNHKLVKAHRDIILNTFDLGEEKNLRTLQRAIRSIEELCKIKELKLEDKHIRFVCALIIEDAKTGKIYDNLEIYNGDRYLTATRLENKKTEELEGTDQISYQFYDRYLKKEINTEYIATLHEYVFTGVCNIDRLVSAINPPDIRDEGVCLLQEIQTGNWMFAKDSDNKTTIAKLVNFLRSTSDTHIGIAIRLRGALGRISRQIDETIPDVLDAMEVRIQKRAKIPDKLDILDRGFSDEEERKDVDQFFKQYHEATKNNARKEIKTTLLDVLKKGKNVESFILKYRHNDLLLSVLSDSEVLDAVDILVDSCSAEPYFQFYNYAIKCALEGSGPNYDKLLAAIKVRLRNSKSSKKLDNGGMRRNDWLMNKIISIKN